MSIRSRKCGAFVRFCGIDAWLLNTPMSRLSETARKLRKQLQKAQERSTAA